MIHEAELELVAERYAEARRQAAVAHQLRQLAGDQTARPSLLSRLQSMLRFAAPAASDDRASSHGIQRVLAS
jgi:hypothetical protein